MEGKKHWWDSAWANKMENKDMISRINKTQSLLSDKKSFHKAWFIKINTQGNDKQQSRKGLGEQMEMRLKGIRECYRQHMSIDLKI